MRTLTFVIALALSACGAAPVQQEEDVSAVWTAGDDAPLEDGED